MKQENARKALEAVAKQNGVPLETVIREIELTIQTAMASPDPAVRSRWANIPRSGNTPTPEELVMYLTERLTDSHL